MKPLDRRTFFSHSLAAASGLVAAPTWLVRAFGLEDGASQDPQPGAVEDPVAKWRKEHLAAAVATAKAHGKPLLVLVVPEEQGAADEASLWFGAWLTHGGEQALLAVGLCTLACARLGEVGEVLRVRGDVLAPTKHAVTMLLVDPVAIGRIDDRSPAATRVELEMAPVPDHGRYRSGELERRTEAVRSGVDAMTRSLCTELDRHGDDLAALALSALAALDATDLHDLDAWVERGRSVPAELLVRGLAELRLRISALPDADRVWRSRALLRAIDEVVVRKQVAGSRWMRGGCAGGHENPAVDEFDPSMWSCGMAMMPPLCERFLDFYSVGG